MWPADYEDLRPEARAMAAAAIELYGAEMAGTGVMVRRYLPGSSPEDARHPSVSPLFADLRAMPPALFTVGLADHLLDDSLFMAARWQAYGNEAELAIYPDCIHGFTFFPIQIASRADARIGTFLDRAFSR